MAGLRVRGGRVVEGRAVIALRRRTRTVRSQQAPAYLPRPGLASVALLLGTCLRRMAKDSRFNEDRSSLVTMLRGRVPYRVIPEYERPVGSCVVRPRGFVLVAGKIDRALLGECRAADLCGAPQLGLATRGRRSSRKRAVCAEFPRG